MQQSPLYLEVTGGRWALRGAPFTINGCTRTLPYHLIDGMYLRYAFPMSPHPKPSAEEPTTLNRLQEAIRKDAERLLVVLMKRFHVSLHPRRYRSVSQLGTTHKAICILHNICVESPRRNCLRRRRRVAEGDGGTICGVGGEAGGGSDGGERKRGGSSASGTAAAGEAAPGVGCAGGVGGVIAAAGAPAPGGGAGGVAAAVDNIDAVGNKPPALNPSAHPHAAGSAPQPPSAAAARAAFRDPLPSAAAEAAAL